MNTSSLGQQVLAEHRFWLQILGDHARFILNALSPLQAEEIRLAQAFIHSFDKHLMEARQELTETQIANLNLKAKESTDQLRTYKLTLLKRQLTNNIAIELPPTFINHMVNELDEYKRILDHLIAGNPPPLVHPLHHHLLWLLDAAGHAGSIEKSLDSTEKRLINKSESFEKQFEHYYLKATELTGYLRTKVTNFPALDRLNQQAASEISKFSNFLVELKQLTNSNEVLSTLLPLLPDHMLREECYYLNKLAQVTKVDKPNCDPTKPRDPN